MSGWKGGKAAIEKGVCVEVSGGPPLAAYLACHRPFADSFVAPACFRGETGLQRLIIPGEGS